MAKKQTWTLERVMPWLLVIGGFIGLLMSFIITYEKIQIWKDPNFVPSCSINPVISCGSVMRSHQAEAFGFPNPLIGLMAYPVVISIGTALLAGAKFKRWFWLGLEAGSIFGVLFCHWLMFQAIYHINALCPYCIVVWLVTIALFLYVTLYNIRVGHIRLKAKAAKLADFVGRHHGDFLVGWYLIVLFMILNHFWYYWSTLI